MKLRLCPDLEIPPDAVSRTFGVLAVRGAGKSNTAAVMAEEMFGAHLPFVVIDPVGSWWGLRSSADGTGPGLPLPIFGGKHGDIQIDRNAGELLAELIVEKRLSCVLDLSRFTSEADKKHFLLKFAQRLYEKNEDPLHLFLEEADDYIPQKPMRDETYLLRAWENIVRRGRARGLGMTLITQRSAAINKMVLTQVETLFAMRTTGPQDIAAIEAWVKYHNVKGELLASLSSLPDGDAWVWSPQFLGITKRVHIRRRQTFDSGATPKNLGADQTKRPATLADVNLQEVRARMAETEQRAKADDPKELRRRLNATTLELNAVKSKLDALQGRFDALKPSKNAPVVASHARSRELEEERKSYVAENTRLQRELVHLRGILKKVGTLVSDYSEGRPATSRPVPDVPFDYRKPERAHTNPGNKITENRRISRQGVEPTGDLTGPEQRILDAIAWLESIGVDTPEQTAVAFLAGYTYGGGAFNNPKGKLRSKALVEYAGDCVRLTEAGRKMARQSHPMLNSEELHAHVMDRLPGPEKKILRVILDAYPKAIDNEDCAIAAGYTPDGGAYNNPRGRLRSLGLIDYPERGKVRARDILFLEG